MAVCLPTFISRGNILYTRPLITPNFVMPLAELDESLGIKRAAHLLRRAAFGANKSQIDAFSTLSPRQAVETLFRATLPEPVLPIDPETGQEWFISGVTDGSSEEFRLGQYFQGWFIAQMLSTGIPTEQSLAYATREKLVLFLHTHFTCIANKIQNSRALYFQNQLFRQFALDGNATDPEVNFKNLTVKISVDNAMLRLLDGNLNVKGSPNENYARELLELYSIGRGLEGTVPQDGLEEGDYYVYKEEDVVAAAQVLSGWEFDETFSNIDADTGLPRGVVKGSPTDAIAHNNAVKVFTERFGNQSVTPDPLLMNGDQATELSALDEVRQLIDIIYSSPLTARNICWKIYRFFVYSPHEKYDAGNRVQQIDTQIIEEMVNVFVSSGYKIQPVIENLLCSEHFYDAVAADVKDDKFGGIVKSPLDLVVGTFRSFDVQLPDMMTQTSTFYEATTSVLYLMQSLGMTFYEPFDVAGYEAYHQFPIFQRIWITPTALAIRYDFIRMLFRSSAPDMFSIDALQYVQENFSAEAPNVRELIKAVALYHLPVADFLVFDDTDPDVSRSTLTYQRMRYFRERFLQGFDEDYWTTRWNEGAGDLREQLEFLFNAMLQTPEYQLS
jgi:uncharacterized protein (DUF1800 family)